MILIVRASKYFKILNLFLKNSTSSPPSWWSQLSLISRSLVAYGALLAAMVGLAWLSSLLEKIPALSLSAWEEDRAPLVVLDAGHGGHDGGAVAGGTLEKKLALELTLQLQAQLIGHGVRVKMTRDSDIFLPLEQRAAIANEAEAAAFISVHLNTSSNTEVSGVETYYTEKKSLSTQRSLQAKGGFTGGAVKDQRGKWLADFLQKRVCQNTQAVNRGIKERNYAVVSQTAVPSALIECGFLTNAAEAKSLQQGSYQKKLISGIAEGILQFLNAHHRQPSRGIQQTTDTGAPDEPDEKAP